MAGALAVGAEQTDLGGDRLVVGDQSAAVAPRPEVLGRVEGEAADVADRAGAPAFIGGAVGLAGVLDQVEVVLGAEVGERAHLDRAAVEVDRDHAASCGGQRRGDDLRGQQRPLLVDIDESGVAPTALTASAVAMKELVGTMTSSPGPISRAAQGELKGGGAGGDADRELATAPVGELALELFDRRPEGEGRASGDVGDGRHQLAHQRLVTVVETDEGDARGRVGVVGTGAVMPVPPRTRGRFARRSRADRGRGTRHSPPFGSGLRIW